MLNWILTIIGFILVLLIVRQLLAAAQVFQNLYSQLVTVESISLPVEPGLASEAFANTEVIPASNSSPAPANSITPSAEYADSEEQNIVDEAAPQYVASLQGTRFHRMDCSSVRRIRKDNRQYFNSHDEAIASGYNPCSICNP